MPDRDTSIAGDQRQRPIGLSASARLRGNRFTIEPRVLRPPKSGAGTGSAFVYLLQCLKRNDVINIYHNGNGRTKPGNSQMAAHLPETPGINDAKVPTKQLSFLLGIGLSRITQLVQMRVLPAPEKRMFALAPCIQAYAEYLRSNKRRNVGDPEAEDGEAEARSRLMIARADIAEMEARRQKGELLERDEVTAVVQNAFSIVKARMRVIPSKVAPQFAVMTPPEIHDHLLKEIDSVLSSLAKTKVVVVEDDKDAKSRRLRTSTVKKRANGSGSAGK